MQRGTSILFALLLTGAIGVVVVDARSRSEPESAVTATDAGLEGGDAGAASAEEAGPVEEAEAGVEAPDLGLKPQLDRLPDGGPVPPLPASAPKSATFGVVLFRYQGAQRAPKDARTKAEARELATQAIERASDDFDEAAKRGDFGSGANLGRVRRGVLEPALEYLLFSLEAGEVHPEPIDSPTGYWVLRRVD